MMEITEDNYESEVAKSEIPVLIDFHAPWCGPCQMMGPVFEELSKDFEGKIKFVKVNTDEQPDLSGRFKVRGIPCLVYTVKGKEKDRIIGFLGKDQIREKIEAMSND